MFTNLPADYEPTAYGTQNGTSVQFVPDGISSSVNMGLNDPAEYCQNNPELCTSRGVAYENIGVVTIPGSTDSDAAHLCNPQVKPNAIILSRFSATWHETAAVIQWTTSTEFNTFSFQLLRSTDSIRDHATRVTPIPIGTQGRGQRGISYSWTDTTVIVGQPYTYWLEETEIGGSTTIYGPVQAQSTTAAEVYRILLPAMRHR